LFYQIPSTSLDAVKVKAITMQHVRFRCKS